MRPFVVPGGEAEDVGPAARVDGVEELLAELVLQHRPRVVEGVADGDVGVRGDGGDQPGDERAVSAVLLEDAFVVALGDLGVPLGAGERRVVAVVVHQAGVDDQDPGGVLADVAVGLGDGRVGPGVARHGHRLVAGAGVDGDVHHVVAADHAASGAALHRGERAQRARDGRVAGRRRPRRGRTPGCGPRRSGCRRGRGGGRGPGRLRRRSGSARARCPRRPAPPPLAREDDAFLVEELARVVGSHGQRDVGHGALDLPVLLMEALRWHGVSSTWGDEAGAAELS